MKKLMLLIVIQLTATLFISAQTFEVVSTKVIRYNSNHNIEFYYSSTDVGSKDFTQMNSVMTHDESIYLQRSGANYEEYGKWDLKQPASSNGEITQNTVSTLSMRLLGEGYTTLALLFEIHNTSGSSANLYYAINPYVTFNADANEHYYQIELYKTNSSASTLTDIFYKRYEAPSSTRERGTAIANIPANGTVYLYYAITTRIVASTNGTRIINGNTTIGFSDSPIPANDDLRNNVLAGNDKMQFQLFNWLGEGNSGIPMGNTGANAYQHLDWAVGYSHAFGLAENVDVADGCQGITFELGNTDLFAFNQWADNSGDSRVYLNGNGTIYQNGVAKLVVNHLRFDMNVPYYGGTITASGWGEIDQASSDPDWVSAFDRFNTGELYFECESVDSPFQTWFNAIVTIVPSPIERAFQAMQIPVGGFIDLSNNLDLTIDINLNKGSNGTKDAQNRIMAFEINGNAGGILPDGIEYIFPEKYWEVGTTASNFTSSLTFSLDGLNNISDYSNLRILKRESDSDGWVVWGDYSVDEVNNQIIANNVDNFCNFAVGSTNSPTPVELVSFTAEAFQNKVQLNWNTATEVNNYGFEIERSAFSVQRSDWEKIGFVQGHGNSNSPKYYSFIDKNPPSGKVQYRLKQIDLNGEFEYSDIVEVTVGTPNKFTLEQNYPNPFNPTTTIKYSIPAVIARSGATKQSHDDLANVILIVYDLLGHEVATLVNQKQAPGNYTVQFDASKLTSGVYFYKLQSGSFVVTKKMILLR